MRKGTVVSPLWATKRDRNRINFEWSLKPFLLLMRCLGISLDFAPYSQRSWKIITIYGLVLFSLNVACHFTMLAMGSDELSEIEDFRKPSPVQLLSDQISSVNEIAVTIGSHFLAIACLLTNWSHVAQIFQCMELHSFYTDQEYRKFRILALVGLVFTVLEAVIVILYTIVLSPANASQGLIEKVLLTGFSIFNVFQYALISLYGILGWTVILLLEYFCKQVESNRKKKIIPKYETTFWERRLNNWKLLHHFIDELVYRINDCFGAFLFLLVASTFIRMIDSSFKSLDYVRAFRDGSTFNRSLASFVGYYFMEDLVIFIAISSLGHQIRQKAKDVGKALRRLEFEDAILQNKANFLITEISHCLPQITAAGFFNVDCQLIPTLIGTILTYLIILYQFDSNGKEVLLESNSTLPEL